MMTDDDILSGLDFVPALECEYSEHGYYGKTDFESEFQVLIRCIQGCFEIEVLMCEPCFTAQRMLYCRVCQMMQSPEQMMHFRGRV